MPNLSRKKPRGSELVVEKREEDNSNQRGLNRRHKKQNT